MSKVELPSTTLDTSSRPFVGRWNHLISTTNWEKGCIILAWREALIAEDVEAGDYSDDAWAQRVGGVTGQHVGRLRRVFGRFGEVYGQCEGLYWSHFQAAIDWDDAEMWLEGAVQNRWSVANMRRQRSETLGEVDSRGDQDAANVLEEFDELLEARVDWTTPATLTEKTTAVREAEREEDDPAVEPDVPSEVKVVEDSTAAHPFSPAPQPAQRMQDLARLPDDLVDAFEAFKLVILRHRAEPWKTCSQDDVINVLTALQELALAPIESK